MASHEIQDGVQDCRQIRKNPILWTISNIGNANQVYTSFCPVSNAERIINRLSIKCFFDEILSKFMDF